MSILYVKYLRESFVVWEIEEEEVAGEEKVSTCAVESKR